MSCGKAGDETRPADVGAVALKLTANAGGHTYRLRHAHFQLSTGAMFDGDTLADAENLRVQLPAGSYSIALQAGWTLQRLDAGSYVDVEATLVSPATVPFEITPNATTQVSYRLSTSGTIVVVGEGTLDVGISVTEGACTVLGSAGQCAAGQWCAPTGDSLSNGQCTTPGTIPVDSPCDPAGGSLCVANAMCIVDGSTPTGQCLLLCSPATGICPMGRTCTQIGLSGELGACL
jgi:hypothetical protein